jgi:hypothetical protein
MKQILVPAPYDAARIRALKARLDAMAPYTSSAMLTLVETACVVAERHAGDARGVEAWRTKSVQYHLNHALDHVKFASFVDDDGMSQASHAVCRLAFALALAPDLVP